MEAAVLGIILLVIVLVLALAAAGGLLIWELRSGGEEPATRPAPVPDPSPTPDSLASRRDPTPNSVAGRLARAAPTVSATSAPGRATAPRSSTPLLEMPRRAAPQPRERVSQAALAAGLAAAASRPSSRPARGNADEDDEDQATVHMRKVQYGGFEEDDSATVVVKAEDFLYDDRSLND